jgi:hypothetical protein
MKHDKDRTREFETETHFVIGILWTAVILGLVAATYAYTRGIYQ